MHIAGRPAADVQSNRTEVINSAPYAGSGFNSCLPVPSSTGKARKTQPSPFTEFYVSNVENHPKW